MRYPIAIALISLGLASYLTFNVYQNDKRFRNFEKYTDKCKISDLNLSCNLFLENPHDLAFGYYEVDLLSSLQGTTTRDYTDQFKIQVIQDSDQVLEVSSDIYSESRAILGSIITTPGKLKAISINVTFIGEDLSPLDVLEIGLTED